MLSNKGRVGLLAGTMQNVLLGATLLLLGSIDNVKFHK